MKYAVILMVGFMLSAGVFAVEVEPQNVLIVEVQTASEASAGEEFVELHNPNDIPTDVTGWLLQYKSATGENWTTKAELEGEIEPRGRYLLATDDYSEEEYDQEFSSGLAASAGHLRLVIPAETDEEEEFIHDQLGWGDTADSAEGDSPAEAPDKGESLKRIVDEDGYFIDTDVNFDDFEVSITPTPVSDPEPEDVEVIEDEVPVDDEAIDNEDIIDEEIEPVVEEGEGGVLGQTKEPLSYPEVWITELFIDPSSPKTDAEDEFIEIFNPSKSAVQLKDYIIQTGNTFSRSFTIPELEVQPGQYLALYSLDTGLPLSNSGSQARILDPDGGELFKTDPYNKAKSDTSWIFLDGKWLWSAQSTPAAPNIVVVPASSSSRKKSSSSSSSRSKSSKSSSSSSSSDSRIVYEEPASIADTEINTAVLIGVGALAFSYAIYEYRHDISNRIHQFRRYIKSRR